MMIRRFITLTALLALVAMPAVATDYSHQEYFEHYEGTTTCLGVPQDEAETFSTPSTISGPEQARRSLDLRQPSVHQYFEYTPQYGLYDHLRSDIPISKALINPGIERLVILPVRKSIEHSSEVLGSERMRRFVTELKTRYPSRFVIFDLPTLLRERRCACILAVGRGGIARNRAWQDQQASSVKGSQLT